MKKVTQAEMERCIKEIGKVVEKHSMGSALRGLDVTAAGFAGLCDIYAQPNADNPEGMCDDPIAFRKRFADFIANLPTLEKLSAGR